MSDTFLPGSTTGLSSDQASTAIPDLRGAARRFAGAPVTRFAPSPTGYLHLGHVVNALYVWGVAGALGGSVLVRIEDHDRLRSRPEFERALLEDLSWLGFLPDGAPVSRQREHHDRYTAALAKLRDAGLVYACTCSRRDIGGERYPGHCRTRGLTDMPGAGLRVRFDGGAERFDDLLLGSLEQRPSDQCGDLLVRDRDGHWTYQFAVTVDDLRQGVTLIVRGADLLPSTGRQLRLRRLLIETGAFPEAPAPVYLHHPLVLGEDRRKLSKSTGATGVRAMRHRGVSPEEVIGRAAEAIGLIEGSARLAAPDAPAIFRRGPTTPG